MSTLEKAWNPKYNRHRITGKLCTKTPLHIGDGNIVSRQLQGGMEGNGVSVDVATVVKDFESKPCIPGSALKGRLRSLIHEEAIVDAENQWLRSLFGAEKSNGVKAEEAAGGNVVFNTAFMQKKQTVTSVFESDGFMDWDNKTHTYVMRNVSINRVTRTAQENHLFYTEVVPRGTAFDVTIDCFGLKEDNLYRLLALLEHLNCEGIGIGGLGVHNYGEMTWTLSCLTAIQRKEDMGTWLEGDAVGFDGMPSLEIDESKFAEFRKIICDNDFLNTRNQLVLDVKLDFEGGFLSLDPSQEKANKDNPDEAQGHTYLQDENGNILLTSRSFRGAFRSQAEKIVRTLCEKKACFPTDKDSDCLKKMGKLPHDATADKILGELCITCQMFGASGWKGPVECSDFVFVDAEGASRMEHEMVAIDRFHGGAAQGKKFKATYLYKPSFEGKIRLDVSRTEAAHLGLLVLTLRDLMEGDITFGYGASRGFGACKATFEIVTAPEGVNSNVVKGLSILGRNAWDEFEEGSRSALDALVAAFWDGIGYPDSDVREA